VTVEAQPDKQVIAQEYSQEVVQLILQLLLQSEQLSITKLNMH